MRGCVRATDMKNAITNRITCSGLHSSNLNHIKNETCSEILNSDRKDLKKK